MSGPREIRDEDLDRAVEDDRLHEQHHGYPLNVPLDIYDLEHRDAFYDEDLEEA